MINCKSDLDLDATGPIQVCSCLSKCILTRAYATACDQLTPSNWLWHY